MLFTKHFILCSPLTTLAAGYLSADRDLHALRARGTHPRSLTDANREAYPEAYPHAYAEVEDNLDRHGLYERYAMRGNFCAGRKSSTCTRSIAGANAIVQQRGWHATAEGMWDMER